MTAQNVRITRKEITVNGNPLATVLVALRQEDDSFEEGMTMPQLVELTGKSRTTLIGMIKDGGWRFVGIPSKHAKELRNENVIPFIGEIEHGIASEFRPRRHFFNCISGGPKTARSRTSLRFGDTEAAQRQQNPHGLCAGHRHSHAATQASKVRE